MPPERGVRKIGVYTHAHTPTCLPTNKAASLINARTGDDPHVRLQPGRVRAGAGLPRTSTRQEEGQSLPYTQLHT